jgi:MoaA/NifB/PqqE/SkfB family radical SAM enzyme
MNLRKKVRIGWKLLQVRSIGRRTPIVVGWDITNRCNLRCAYCRQPEIQQDELDEASAMRVAREMIRSGVEVVTFSGGEPLIRNDLGQIAAVLDDGGVFLSLNTNGTLIDANREMLRRFDHVKVSLDGPEEVHDAIRGRGVFAKVLNGLDSARSLGLHVSIGTVITSSNVQHIDEVFRIASEHGARVLFQPVTTAYAHGMSIAHLTPSPEIYRSVMNRIIEGKIRTEHVINSVPALEYLRAYPESPMLHCYGGKGIGRICADGTLVPCVTMRDSFRGRNVKECSFAEAFASIPDSGCGRCWCSSTLDFNLLMKPDIRIIGSMTRRAR